LQQSCAVVAFEVFNIVVWFDALLPFDGQPISGLLLHRENQMDRVSRFGHWAIGLVALGSSTCWAETYYVDAVNGSNAFNGLSATQAWQTLDNVNRPSIPAGSTVLFRKGQAWSGTLVGKNDMSYGAYPATSAEPLPVIRGSVGVGGLAWKLHEGAIYSAVLPESVLPPPGSTAWGVAYAPDITQLFNKGVRMQRARHPNIGGGHFRRGQNRFFKGSERVVKQVNGYSGVMAAGQILTNARGRKFEFKTALVGAQAYIKVSDYNLKRFDVQVPDSALSTADVIFSRDLTWGGYLDGIQSAPGYWLENKLWMLDRPGEWVFDAKTRTLYVWMKDGSNPASHQDLRVAVHDHAFVARDVNKIAVQDLEFSETRRDALSIDRTQDPGGVPSRVMLKGLVSQGAGGSGLAITNAVTGSGLIDSSKVYDSASAGIYLGIDSTRKINVTNSQVSNAGLGFFAEGGIVLGLESQAKGNIVSRSSYIGIRGARFNLIEYNLVQLSCLEFDDGGGIYVRGNDFQYGDTKPVSVRALQLNDVINKNSVRGAASAPDRLDGAHANVSAVKGIYLDDFAEAVTVSNNTVVGDDYGVMIHLGRNNQVNGNALSASKVAQLWLQEDNGNPPATNVRNCSADQVAEGCDGSNYMRLNTITGNTMTPTSTSYVIKHSSDYGGTTDFARYANNRYKTTADKLFMRDDARGRQVPDLSFDSWRVEFNDIGSSLTGLSLP
jgi:parallel beta-helix repeat protein